VAAERSKPSRLSSIVASGLRIRLSAAGVPPTATHARLGEGPFSRSVVHDAIAQAGFADRIVGLCRDWRDRVAGCPACFHLRLDAGFRRHDEARAAPHPSSTPEMVKKIHPLDLMTQVIYTESSPVQEVPGDRP
jgi:hypothetical protein